MSENLSLTPAAACPVADYQTLLLRDHGIRF
jgi:hypothetical protein